jgi:glyoxalase/bleomycin resistance protein/dioxygenase superfamily protein
MVTGIDVFGFRVGDAAKSIEFYRDKLGMVATHFYDQNRGAIPGAPAGGGVLLAVDDIKAAVTEYRSKGLEISEVSHLIVHQRKAS